MIAPENPYAPVRRKPPAKYTPPPEPVAPRGSRGLGWLIVATVMVVVVVGSLAAFGLQGGSTAALLGGVDPAAPPTFGVATLSPTTGRTMAAHAGTTEGSHAASVFGTGCRGYVPSAPHLALRVTGYQYVSLTTASSADLTMVLRDPSGHVRCDDDSGEGLNPRISTALEPGTWTVWVGSFNEDTRAPFTLLIDAQGLDARPDPTGLAPDATPSVAAVDLDRTPAGTTIADTVSGIVDGRLLRADCHGWFPPAPQVTLTTARGLVVDLATTSQDTTVVAVRGPTGVVQCGSPGSGGRMTVALAAGRSAVWVGSTEEGHGASFSLAVLPLESAVEGNPSGRREPPGAVPMLAMNAPPTLGVINLDTAAAGSVTGMVTGRQALGSLGHGCVGYADTAPTAVIQTATARPIRIRATSPEDTVMLIRGAGGETFCNDDADGTHDPRLDLTVPPGRHMVWIGTYQSEATARFTLSATVLEAVRGTTRRGGK